VINVSNVSKKFRIWEDRSRDLKETTINFLRGKKRSFRELWALRGINLKIKESETVAFIGENGSGKSTMLKLLCGIYVPDEGKIVTRGKISSLLDLGVGFHPDLTGEENIYLNGAMLGFDRKEMKKRFEEVVSFSEIGDFIYSPIRTYSSGMVMRLGFSVAMCVDPDILLIDEVLAVGDEAFQKKCLARLEEFKKSGKTIVLVSHGLGMVKIFCERVILLHGGRVVCDDVPEKAIEAYHVVLYGQEYSILHRNDTEVHEIEGEDNHPAEMPPGDKEESREKTETIQENAPENIPEGSLEAVAPKPPCYQRYGTFEAEITEVLIKSSEQGKETDSFISGEMISICLLIRFHRDIENPNVGMAILGHENGKMMVVYSTNTLRRNMNLGFLKGNTDIEVEFIQRIPLPEGEYYLTVAITNSYDSGFYDWHENLKSFQIKKVDPRWEGAVDLNSEIIIRK
jgi:ABC-type polysaccharide/polyol phosphate transport system ATPase subunit